MSLSLYVNTVRHLKPVQLWASIPRARNAKSGHGEPPTRRGRRHPWQRPVLRASAQTAPSRFRFLNQEREIRTWNDPGIPKLWLYNLHYFEHPDAGLVQRWIAENPAGQGNGWEPYPSSLRVTSWIKWALGGESLTPVCMKSLEEQARWLSCRVEHHLLANHVFVNAKALVFAGAFFAGPQADGWLHQGLELLRREVPEQILADGGHFERSPMYHALILEDLLDLVNLQPPGAPIDAWGEAAARMLAWLRQISHPDGRISFFNDAAFGIAPEPAELYDYAGRLGVVESPVPLKESGYIRLENANSTVLFDAAPIGPDYQPGHAHADTLSFELSHRGRRLLVNSGTGTYESGPERHRQRGTPAHNTVVVDGENQSEVWAAFRVARRARPFAVATDHRSFAEAAHDGYRRLNPSVIHRRRLELSPAGLVVTDSLEGRGEHSIEICFHLHPEAQVEVQLDSRLSSRIEASTWHPEFNVSVPNKKIIGSWKGALPVVFRTFIPLP